MKKKYIIVLGIIIVVGVSVLLNSSKTKAYPSIENFAEEIGIYKSSSCGCCNIYVDYFQNKGNSNAEDVNLQDIESFKKEKGIPDELWSCHTTVMGGYFIEGHIPLEAVEKLLKENPDIAGIAMPGMPEGSPGMMGSKSGDFIVYSINYDGSYQEFMRI